MCLKCCSAPHDLLMRALPATHTILKLAMSITITKIKQVSPRRHGEASPRVFSSDQSLRAFGAGRCALRQMHATLCMEREEIKKADHAPCLRVSVVNTLLL